MTTFGMVDGAGTVGRLEGRHLLVVEDEVLLALDLSCQIEADGGVADMASSSREALCLIDGQPYDGAVLDYHLTDGTSLPVADALQARGIPFVFVTAQASETRLRERHPSVPVFDKPVLADRLSRDLGRFFGLPRRAAHA